MLIVAVFVCRKLDIGSKENTDKLVMKKESRCVLATKLGQRIAFFAILSGDRAAMTAEPIAVLVGLFERVKGTNVVDSHIPDVETFGRMDNFLPAVFAVIILMCLVKFIIRDYIMPSLCSSIHSIYTA